MREPLDPRDDPGSGLLVAEQAHRVGAVAQVEPQPMREATLTLRLHGDPAHVQALLDTTVERLAQHPLVMPPVVLAERAP